jgi:hypothetical protein
MDNTLCLECGGVSPLYHGYKIDLCPKCARERINKYFRGAVA